MLYQENREKDRWQSLIDRSASSENRRRWKGRVRTTTHHAARTPRSRTCVHALSVGQRKSFRTLSG